MSFHGVGMDIFWNCTFKEMLIWAFNYFLAPSQAPSSFTMSSLSSTSVKASWQLPPVGSRHGIITGFKLLYRRKSSGDDSLTILTIESNSTLTRDVTGLHKYTEYEFQVLTYSFVGNGPKSSVEPVRTDEDGKV